MSDREVGLLIRPCSKLELFSAEYRLHFAGTVLLGLSLHGCVAELRQRVRGARRAEGARQWHRAPPAGAPGLARRSAGRLVPAGAAPGPARAVLTLRVLRVTRRRRLTQ